MNAEQKGSILALLATGPATTQEVFSCLGKAGPTKTALGLGKVLSGMARHGELKRTAIRGAKGNWLWRYSLPTDKPPAVVKSTLFNIPTHLTRDEARTLRDSITAWLEETR